MVLAPRLSLSAQQDNMLLNLVVLPFLLNALTLIQLLVNASHVFKATMLKVEFAKGSFALKDKFPLNTVSSVPTSPPSAELTIFSVETASAAKILTIQSEMVNASKSLMVLLVVKKGKNLDMENV
jgi:hypothetical protein